MIKIFYILTIVSFSYLGFGQKKTDDDCKKNQQLEKELIVNNKLTKIEAIQYNLDKKQTPISKMTYYFNTAGLLTKQVSTSIFNGKEKIIWTGNYIYNISGLCDSVPTDKGYRKVASCVDLYPTCYWHLHNKKLKDGLTLKSKPQKNTNALPDKVVYYFKRD